MVRLQELPKYFVANKAGVNILPPKSSTFPGFKTKMVHEEKFYYNVVDIPVSLTSRHTKSASRPECPDIRVRHFIQIRSQDFQNQGRGTRPL